MSTAKTNSRKSFQGQEERGRWSANYDPFSNLPRTMRFGSKAKATIWLTPPIIGIPRAARKEVLSLWCAARKCGRGEARSSRVSPDGRSMDAAAAHLPALTFARTHFLPRAGSHSACPGRPRHHGTLASRLAGRMLRSTEVRSVALPKGKRGYGTAQRRSAAHVGNSATDGEMMRRVRRATRDPEGGRP